MVNANMISPQYLLIGCLYVAGCRSVCVWQAEGMFVWQAAGMFVYGRLRECLCMTG